MILEYLSDGADTIERASMLSGMACACQERARTLMDAVRNVSSAPMTPRTPRASQPALGAFMPDAPMDNRHAFAPMVQTAPPRSGCRSCSGGRGDVNVNVNVAAGTKSSAGSGGTTPMRSIDAPRRRMDAPTFEGDVPMREQRPRHEDTDAEGADFRQRTASDVRRIVAEELRRTPSPIPVSAPTTSPAPAAVPTKPIVEYRPFAVPRDRVVIRREPRPFAVVWDRIKRIVQPRDVNHPIDRVHTVVRPMTKPTFEGGPA